MLYGGDHLAPKWNEAGRVHDWRNYISEELRKMWGAFTPDQKAALARNADEQALREHWD